MDDFDREDPSIRRKAATQQLAIGVGVLVFAVLCYFGINALYGPMVVALVGIVGFFITLDAVLRFSGRRLPRWMVLGLFSMHAAMLDEHAREEREARMRPNVAFDPAASQRDATLVMGELRQRRNRAIVETVIGVVSIVAGIMWAVYRHDHPATSSLHQLMPFAPIMIGFYLVVAGAIRWLNAEEGLIKPTAAKDKRNNLTVGFGFRTFVAWRYLMARHHRVSRVVLGFFMFALFVAVTSYVAQYLIIIKANPLALTPERMVQIARILLIGMVAGIVLVFFSTLVGLLRFVFSFFTTVPIVGVWIGTGALICVLAVMSGFETDLRQKILGSNAHIQITAESGDIANWREVKARIDKVPGVKSSTPFAVSEVVIAANNNGMNVIIKGIDPETVGSVTKLIQSIKGDKLEAMKRLEPLVDDTHDLTVPQPPPGTGAGSGSDVFDPPPDDMPGRGEPIDFSSGGPDDSGDDSDDADTADPATGSATGKPDGKAGKPAGSAQDFRPIDFDTNEPLDMPPAPPGLTPTRAPSTGSGSAGSAAAGSGSAGSAAGSASDDHYGGDAEYLVGTEPIIDPPPDDLITTDQPPIDYSGDTEPSDLPVHAVDIPYEPAVSHRTQSLPGILVGAELVKQTHLYVGEEVRVVSPLSDPSNPDATGTPIPFNRDYRVAGIFFTGMYEYDLKYVYVTLDSLTDFLDRGDVVDGIEVRVASPDDTDTMVPRLQAALGKAYRVVDWKELNRSLFSALKLEKIAMFLVLGIVILVASFSIVGNLIMVVVEKAREIALLKTLGASDGNLMLVFAIQGLLIGVVGTGFGVAMGLAACWFGKEYGIPLNPDVYYIDKMPVNVDPESVVLTAIFGVMISMAATFYPAIVAARVRPAAGMRH